MVVLPEVQVFTVDFYFDMTGGPVILPARFYFCVCCSLVCVERRKTYVKEIGETQFY